MSYGYTTAGDLTSLAIQMAGTGNDVTYTLGYTAAHELDSEAASNEKYVWDPNINNPGTDNYGIPNNLNQYPNVTFSGQGKQRLTYDGNGSLLSDSIFSYTYDPENRLLSATGSSTTTYANDPKGRRATKVSGGTTTNFLDDGDDEIGEYDGSGNLLRRFVPGPAIDEPIAEVTASGTYEYFHSDHHGSVIAMSASSGGLIEGQFVYDSYGNSTCSGAGGVPFRYTGQYLDPETCLYYYRARYYSPTMGRFLQVDPVGYTADMDLYAYVRNDPTNATDPSGNDRITDNGGDTSDCGTSDMCHSYGGLTVCTGASCGGQSKIVVGGAVAKTTSSSGSAKGSVGGQVPTAFKIVGEADKTSNDYEWKWQYQLMDQFGDSITRKGFEALEHIAVTGFGPMPIVNNDWVRLNAGRWSDRVGWNGPIPQGLNMEDITVQTFSVRHSNDGGGTYDGKWDLATKFLHNILIQHGQLTWGDVQVLAP